MRHTRLWRVSAWRKRIRRSARALRGLPVPVQLVIGTVLLVSVWAAVNGIVQVARKPSEAFVVVSESLGKPPAETCTITS